MKRVIKLLIIMNILIVSTFLIVGKSVAVSSEVDKETKSKVTTFLNNEDNIFLFSFTYSSPKKMSYAEGEGLMWCLGTVIGDIPSEEDAYSEDKPYFSITGGLDFVTITKEQADNFFKEKFGIAFDETSWYQEYKEKHTVSGEPNIFYQGIKNGDYGIRMPEKNNFTINSIRKLEDGNIAVGITYGENADYIYNKNVILEEQGDTYVFISCIGYGEENIELIQNKISEFINKHENKIFSCLDYKSIKEMSYQNCEILFHVLASSIGSQPEGDVFSSDTPYYSITHGMKSYKFTKEQADKLFMEKFDITLDKTDWYEEYKEKHTISGEDNVFYQVTEGMDPGIPEKYRVKSVKILRNGYIETEVEYERDTNIINPTVTLQPIGDKLIFVSVANNYQDTEQDVQKEENSEDVTTAKGNIPQTGDFIDIIKYLTICFGVFVIIGFIRYRSLKNNIK